MSAPQATEFLSGGQRAISCISRLYPLVSRYISSHIRYIRYISLYPAISGLDIMKSLVQRRDLGVSMKLESRELVGTNARRRLVACC